MANSASAKRERCAKCALLPSVRDMFHRSPIRVHGCTVGPGDTVVRVLRCRSALGDGGYSPNDYHRGINDDNSSCSQPPADILDPVRADRPESGPPATPSPAPRTASRDTRSCSRSSPTPRRHSQSISCSWISSSSRRHRSTSTTACPSPVSEPSTRHCGNDLDTPRTTYSLSVDSRTAARRDNSSNAQTTAINSIRLPVVAGSPPKISPSPCPERSNAPHPPGPGLPQHTPPVKISTTSSPPSAIPHDGTPPDTPGTTYTGADHFTRARPVWPPRPSRS